MSHDPSIHILIDDRERGSSSAESILGMDEFAADFQRLKVGDYLVDGRLIVERKTFVDLVASIEDGRFFRQAVAMADSKHSPLLIIEGRSSDLAGNRMRREAIQGALITVSLILGIPILRALDGKETARLILFAARQIRRAARGAVPRPGFRPKGKRKLQLHILQGLPNVGPGRAGLLLKRFGTIETVIAASEEELMGVEAIGKATARKIRWAVQECGIPYNVVSALAPPLQPRQHFLSPQ